jgi:beta-N-acetylglucosaminidase
LKEGQKLTKKLGVSIKIIATLCFFLLTSPNSYQAYSDLSSYRIETGKFVDGENAKKGLKQLQKDTGWTGTYKETEEYQKYYKIISSRYSGESKVKMVLKQFEDATGIDGTYVGIGEPQNYYQIVSRYYSGESKVKRVLQQLEISTGIKGGFVGIGGEQNYYQITSGGFAGESRVKQVLQEFENTTGINGTYIGIGQSQEFYKINSGGFIGESRVKQVLQQFVKSTGIKATYMALGNNRFKITSESVLGITEVNQGLNFFKTNNWWATYKSTGEIGYKTYRIKSDPVLGLVKVNKGLDFFKKENWWVIYKSTGQKGYEKYIIKSEPLLGMVLVKKGRDFFSNNHLSSTYQSTGQKGYEKYLIKSKHILGMDLVKTGVAFFKSNNWSVTYQATGEKQNYYQIILEDFRGHDSGMAAIQKIKNLYGWSATAVKTKNGPQLMYTDYGMTLDSMLDKQMATIPQTDTYRNEPRYVYADYVDLNKQVITEDNVNMRTAPSTSSSIAQKLYKGDRVMVIGKTGDWVEVRITWQNAKESDVKDYLDPSNFSIDNKDYFQFLKLSQPANLNVNEVNQKILYGKGILAGKGQAFINAAKKYNINEVYLISHSLLETGNGSSTLANGVEYSGKKVYNMYGYGAFDSCPLTCGAQKAYENEWFTPEAAIIGGAQFISQGYIYNDTFQQDTLYKMKWNPVSTWHQYATDIGWAYKQTSSIYNLYQLIDNYTLYYDVPSYR